MPNLYIYGLNLFVQNCFCDIRNLGIPLYVLIYTTNLNITVIFLLLNVLCIPTCVEDDDNWIPNLKEYVLGFYKTTPLLQINIMN